MDDWTNWTKSVCRITNIPVDETITGFSFLLGYCQCCGHHLQVNFYPKLGILQEGCNNVGKSMKPCIFYKTEKCDINADICPINSQDWRLRRTILLNMMDIMRQMILYSRNKVRYICKNNTDFVRYIMVLSVELARQHYFMGYENDYLQRTAFEESRHTIRSTFQWIWYREIMSRLRKTRGFRLWLKTRLCQWLQIRIYEIWGWFSGLTANNVILQLTETQELHF